MSKKLLFIHLRVSEDLKQAIEADVKQKQKKTPWTKVTEAAYIREAIVFYREHKKCREGLSAT